MKNCSMLRSPLDQSFRLSNVCIFLPKFFFLFVIFVFSSQNELFAKDLNNSNITNLRKQSEFSVSLYRQGDFFNAKREFDRLIHIAESGESWRHFLYLYRSRLYLNRIALHGHKIDEALAPAQRNYLRLKFFSSQSIKKKFYFQNPRQKTTSAGSDIYDDLFYEATWDYAYALFANYRFQQSLAILNKYCFGEYKAPPYSTENTDQLTNEADGAKKDGCRVAIQANYGMISYLSDTNNEKMKTLADNYYKERHSRSLSMLMSFLIPGSGQLYNRDYRSAFLHFVTVSLLATVSWYSFSRERWVSGGTALYLATLYHLHNVNQSGRIADRYNDQLILSRFRRLKLQYTHTLNWWIQ